MTTVRTSAFHFLKATAHSRVIHLCAAYPGAPSVPKVESAFKDCINLTWTPPSNTGGTNILGYNLEKRKKGSNIWSQVNPHEELIKGWCFYYSKLHPHL